MPLFFNNREEKLTRQGITYILQKYAEDTGIGNITPHVLRHIKAVHLTEAGINPVYIRDFLGHTDLKVTQIYSKTSVQIKRKAIEKLADQKSPIPETDMEIRTKDWLDDRDFFNILLPSDSISRWTLLPSTISFPLPGVQVQEKMVFVTIFSQHYPLSISYSPF